MSTDRTKIRPNLDLDLTDRIYTTALSSPHYVETRRRIFRQLVESLLYENIVPFTLRKQLGYNIWEIEGRGMDGEHITYTCKGTKHLTFGRIRIGADLLIRKIGGKVDNTGTYTPVVEAEAVSIALFLLEIRGAIGAEETKLVHFIKELEQTLINDTLARYVRAESQSSKVDLHAEDWESIIIEGHPYHPSYKSRMGFDIQDQLEFGPEFAQQIRPLWVGIHKSKARISHSINGHSPDLSEWLHEQLGNQIMSRFSEVLRDNGVDPAAFVVLPVHPWQWRTTISSVLASDIQNGNIVMLGIGDDSFTAQQSIRTLANCSRPDLPYLKLSLSIINTSTGRVLAPHTVENAPLITDWMQGILKKDLYLKDELRIILLGEVAGVAYDNSHIPEALRPFSYGVLSCIWRESLHSYLQPNEAAIPFNALATVDKHNRPIIDPWIQQYGAQNWLKDILNITVRPLIHWLFAHGIALESHAQNMVLIHQEGQPTRIALKDFHDGIRFIRENLTNPDACPILIEAPEHHRLVNRNSFLETHEPAEVRDFMHDAFFFINLGELALFMHSYFEITEQHFWGQVHEIIMNYQLQFPEYNERYKMYSLFAPEIGVEQLTKRRLFPDNTLHIHQVPNPLASNYMDKYGLFKNELINNI
ncbi:IucA/IucC family protein [Paenibacillus pini]|nr:IucA/IucC family protein [Paenibacillus pini]